MHHTLLQISIYACIDQTHSSQGGGQNEPKSLGTRAHFQFVSKWESANGESADGMAWCGVA